MKCLFGLSSVSFSYGNIYDWNKNMSAHSEMNYTSWVEYGVRCAQMYGFKMRFDDDNNNNNTDTNNLWNRVYVCVCALASALKMLCMLVTLSFCWLPVYCNRLIFHRLHFHVHTQTNRKTGRISHIRLPTDLRIFIQFKTLCSFPSCVRVFCE